MILDEICAHKREELKETKKTRPLSELEEALERQRPPRNFRDALRTEGISLIAEIKKASPSKGKLIENGSPTTLGALYEKAGARAISILTESKYFDGSLEDFVNVRQNVALPCIRKEFIVDTYQIYEARVADADAILLIVKALSDTELREFLELATTLKMATVVETHDAHEIERALKAGAHIIGINNRDLDTFEVDLTVTMELKKIVPGGNVLVSESGIRTREDVKILEDGGIDAILVGEALITSNDIYAKVHELMGTHEG